MKTKRGKKPTNKKPQPRRDGEEKRIRHRMEEALLAERLGLDDDWIDRWEEDGQCKEESFALAELPAFIPAKIQEQVEGDRKATTLYEEEQIRNHVKRSVDSVNDAIERLVAAGCRKPVIYFCLNELSPEAEMSRLQYKPVAGLKESNPGWRAALGRSEDDADIPVSRPPKKLAQQQELKELPTVARRARRLIHPYRDELCLVAHAIERGKSWQRARRAAGSAQEGNSPPTTEPEFGEGIDMPSSMLTELEIAEDVLSLVESSLLWVARLAKVYTAPFEEGVLKSKGFLFLTAYVDRHARSNFRGKAWDGRDSPLSVLTNLVGGKQWPPSYLKAKLQKFKDDYPDLHDLLIEKLDELHEFHRPRRVLFLCTDNSARSQMAEGLLRHLAGEHYEVFSAGARPASLNPNAVQAMAEAGIDISAHRSKSVDEFAGQAFDYVVTVCDSPRESCPTFPGTCQRLHHSFQDPAALPADHQLEAFRRVRDEIALWVVRLFPRLHKSRLADFPQLPIFHAAH